MRSFGRERVGDRAPSFERPADWESTITALEGSPGATPTPAAWESAVNAVNAAAEAQLPPAARGADAATALPAPAADKLRRLREASEEGRAVLLALADAERAARIDLHAAQATLRAFDEAAGRMDIRADDDRIWRDSGRAQRVAAVEEAEARLARLVERKARREQSGNAALLGAVERWLASHLGAAMIEMAPPIAVKLSKNQTAAGEVEAMRARLAELRADLHAVRSAPVTREMARAKVRAWVERLAEIGAIDVLPVIERGVDPHVPLRSTATGSPGFPLHAADLVGPVPRRLGNASVDVLPVVAWLFHDRLVDRLDAEIDALADDAGALTDDERDRREREILRQIDEVERREEALIEAAEEAGAPIARRDDAAPAAVLGVRLVNEIPAP